MPAELKGENRIGPKRIASARSQNGASIASIASSSDPPASFLLFARNGEGEGRGFLEHSV